MSDPLRQLCADLAQRSAQHPEPLDPSHYPADWTTAVAALNTLLADVARSQQAHLRFIAEAAHELRSPLASIQLHADILASETDPEISRQALHYLQQGVARSSRLCQMLLEHSRLEVLLGKEPVRSSIDLVQLARQVIGDHDELAVRRNVSLRLLAPTTCILPADARSLALLLDNLLRNALHHAPLHSTVDVSIQQHEHTAVLSVSDHGPGIPESHWRQAFQPFWREAGKHSGYGLGLAIAHDAVRLHAGRISLDHTPGGGLTVRIELPLAPFSSVQIS